MSPDPDHRPEKQIVPRELLRTYGRRRGHKLSARQKKILQELLPALRIDPSVAQLDRLGELFIHNPDEVWLEIGFGAGEHLRWQARNRSDIGFIGCEPFINGVAKLVCNIHDRALSNIRIYDDDVRYLLSWLPPGQIGRVFLLFPDPWPKKKHRKRRLISIDMLENLARVMKPGAELRIASDIGDYIYATLAAIRMSSDFCWLDNGIRDWRRRKTDWPETRYEKKAIQQGRKPVYLTFQRL